MDEFHGNIRAVGFILLNTIRIHFWNWYCRVVLGNIGEESYFVFDLTC